MNNVVVAEADGGGDTPEPTAKTSAWYDAAVHGVVLGAACLVAYELTTHLLRGVHSVAHSDDAIGGLWAVIATVFVYRDTSSESVATAVSRVAATGASLIICLAYLLIAHSHPWAWALLIALGATLVAGLGRPDLVIMTAITIAVIMVVAELEPRNAWEQPIFRFIDTVIGVLVGVGAAGLALRATTAAGPTRRR